jgi:hypothetical protein
VTNRQFALSIAGIALVLTGLLALWFPVYLDHFDQYGVQISCGKGFSSNLTQAANADGNGLVAQCGTALLIRRAWAIPLTVMGWLLVTGVLAVWVHNSPPKDEQEDTTGA